MAAVKVSRADLTEHRARALHRLHLIDHGATWQPDAWDQLTDQARATYRRVARADMLAARARELGRIAPAVIEQGAML